MKHSPLVQQLAELVDSNVAAQVTDVSRVIEALEVKALARVHDLMENGTTQKIQLDAAKDLLDRGNRTSKVQRVQATSVQITGAEALELAREVAAARRVRQEFAGEVQGNWDKIEKAEPSA